MRTFLFGGALALAFLAPTSVRAQAPAGQKFAFVNSQLILQSAPGAAEAQAQFQKDVESLRVQVQALSDTMQQLGESYAREEAGLSPQAKEARLKSLREREAGYQQRVEKLNEQAEQRQFELMSPIMDGVRKVLDEMREEGGYAFIFDVANASFIVAADKNLDITEKVVAKLRTASRTATPAASGPTSRPSGVQARPPRTPPAR